VVNEGRTVSERGLYPGRMIIGRASDADLRVDSRVISRHHCQITTNDRLCVIEDLNSTNGVFIKDKRVRRHNLNDGDVVSLGSHQLMYIDERPGTRLAVEGDSASTGSHKVLAVVGETTQN
jgi:general secretion pathway protein A